MVDAQSAIKNLYSYANINKKYFARLTVASANQKDDDEPTSIALEIRIVSEWPDAKSIAPYQYHGSVYA